MCVWCGVVGGSYGDVCVWCGVAKGEKERERKSGRNEEAARLARRTIRIDRRDKR